MANEQKPAFEYDPSLEDMVIPGGFQNATEGSTAAVLVDVVPLGFMEQTDKTTGVTKNVFKIDAIFQIEERREPKPGYDEGLRFTVRRRYSLSLNEKAAFRPVYEALVGRAVTSDEENGKAKLSVRDLFKLIGKSVLINVVRSKDGKYDNISTVSPLPKALAPVTAEAYVRIKDRAPKAA